VRAAPTIPVALRIHGASCEAQDGYGSTGPLWIAIKPIYSVGVDRNEYLEFQRNGKRRRAAQWWLIILASAAVGYGLALAWSFIGGVAVGSVCVLIGIELHRELERVRWLRRFPELAESPEPQWHPKIPRLPKTN
jgi:hypothetical protein